MRWQRLHDGDDLRGEAPRTLVAYWQGKCAGRPRPEWRDIHLMDLWQVADRLAVKDVLVDGGDFRNRYWGGRLTEAFAVDGTGKTPAEIVGDPDNRESATINFRRVVETRAPILSHRRLTFMDGRDHVAFEAVHLPLGPPHEAVRHIISAYDFDGDLGDILGR